MIKNTREYITGDNVRDIHIQVSEEMYQILNSLVESKKISSKTDFIKTLIEKDRKYKREKG